jgi:predicted deacylase
LHVNAEDFDPGKLAAGRKHQFFLELGIEAGDANVGFPVLIANGRASGKTLVAFAGVHGDEFEGIQAVHETFERLNPAEMSGRFIVVPVAHVAAYHSSHRLSPVDGLNLARTFPGKRDGSPTERVAHYLSEKIIAHADFFIDLHSGGTAYLLPMMIGYDATESDSGRMSLEAARHVGMPVMWGHKQLAPGRSLCEAARRDIPWLYTESAGGGRVLANALVQYENALEKLLRFLRIVPGILSESAPEVHLLGDGDLDHALFAETAGFFAARVGLLEAVDQYQVIGLIRDMFGATLAEVRSPFAGVVAMLRANPVVSRGDSVCLLAQQTDIP